MAFANLRRLISLLIGFAVIGGPVAAEEKPPIEIITGWARAVDGDTVAIGDKHIRLYGIDAPEHNQNCLDGSNNEWKCGAYATSVLRQLALIGPFRCEVKRLDKYRRNLSICWVGEAEVNRYLLLQGAAIVYLTKNESYVTAERDAREALRGIWVGVFLAPERFRHPRP